jgi:dolichol kinase
MSATQPTPPGYHPQAGLMQPPPQPPQKMDEMAIASLVCGIISVVLIFPGCICGGYMLAWAPGVAAIVLGVYGRKKIRQNPDTLVGDNLALTGLITGICGAALSALVIVLYILFVVFEIAALSFLQFQGGGK